MGVVLWVLATRQAHKSWGRNQKPTEKPTHRFDQHLPSSYFGQGPVLEGGGMKVNDTGPARDFTI